MEVLNKVSLWVAKFNSSEELSKFMEERFDRNGDVYSDFMKSFKIGFIDNHFQEVDFYGDLTVKQDVFDGFSYVESFIENIPNENWSDYNSVILLYNFEYNQKVKQSKKVKFVGSFEYVEE
ncbi:immunity 22 family protein [Tenacibaculum sp. 190524A05c]|uniref:Immunity protein 22 of polymorphic toxin system n=1 Tax=Tenacibaculum platacis TaxID=3137852 RepID=A0ABM9NUT3_9FLAO